MFVTRSFAVYEPLSPYVHDGVGPLASLKSSSPSNSHANVSVSPSSPFTTLPLPSKFTAVPSGVDTVGAITASGSHEAGVAVLTVGVMSSSSSGPAVTPSSLSAKIRQIRHWFP